MLVAGKVNRSHPTHTNNILDYITIDQNCARNQLHIFFFRFISDRCCNLMGFQSCLLNMTKLYEL